MMIKSNKMINMNLIFIKIFFFLLCNNSTNKVRLIMFLLNLIRIFTAIISANAIYLKIISYLKPKLIKQIF